jgi:pilus assembly protein Flp/PilA
MDIRNRVVRFCLTSVRREEGQTMTEYGVLLALIAVVVIVALLFLGPQIANTFSFVGSKL